jgi:outer membrane protein assembly factor BamA
MPHSFRKLVAAVALVVCALPAAGPATAQTATTAASTQEYAAKKVRFEGAPEYSYEELLATTGWKSGLALDTDGMRACTKKLMDTGLFSQATFQFDGEDLTFRLTLADELYAVRLGNVPIAVGADFDSRLHELVPLYHGKVPADGTVLEDVRNALEAELKAEDLEASVKAAPYTDPKLAKVTAMEFNIAAPDVLVGKVKVESRTADPSTEVLDLVSKIEGTSYDQEGSPSQIKANVGGYYRDKGFLEVKVNMQAQAPVNTGGAIRVPFLVSVEPGTQYRIIGVQLAPGLLVSQADFDKQSQIHAGDVADGVRVRQNWEFLSRQYHNIGYMKAKINPVPAYDREKGTVSYTVKVEPGPQYKMGTLTIQNSAADLKAAMLEAWKMPAGAVFNEGAVRAYFTTQDVYPALERTFAKADCIYKLALNDDLLTVDVTLRVQKKDQ